MKEGSLWKLQANTKVGACRKKKNATISLICPPWRAGLSRHQFCIHLSKAVGHWAMDQPFGPSPSLSSSGQCWRTAVQAFGAPQQQPLGTLRIAVPHRHHLWGRYLLLFFRDSAELFFLGVHDGTANTSIQPADIISNSAGFMLKQHSIQMTFLTSSIRFQIHMRLPRMSFLTWKEAKGAFFFFCLGLHVNSALGCTFKRW